MVAKLKKKSLVIDDIEADAKFPIPVESDFIVNDELKEFIRHDELARLGKALINKRGAFSDLKHCQITFLFKKEGGKSKGKQTLGKCQKPSGLLSYFSKSDFIIWVAADHLRGVSWWIVEAVLFHELKHASIDYAGDDGEKKTAINPHDAEVFVDEIRFYGVWRSDLEKLREVFQPTLFDLPNEAASLTKRGREVIEKMIDGGKLTTVPGDCPTRESGPLPPELGGHAYEIDGTSDCAYGCGAWMGPYRSGTDDDSIDPFGKCPKNSPENDPTLEPEDDIERQFVEDGAKIVTHTDRKTGTQHRVIDTTEAAQKDKAIPRGPESSKPKKARKNTKPVSNSPAKGA